MTVYPRRQQMPGSPQALRMDHPPREVPTTQQASGRRFSFEGIHLLEEQPNFANDGRPAPRQHDHLETVGPASLSSFDAVYTDDKNRPFTDRDSRLDLWNRLANRWWLYELFSSLTAFACFTALIVVLSRSDGNEQTRWFFGHLTLNGLVALLSTFIRASMMLTVGASLSQMKWNHFSSRATLSHRARRLQDLDIFDQASRGPLGSLRLLLARSKPHLGLIGAVITIFTLAFDAFAQEVIVLRFRLSPSANGALAGELPRSETYDRWTKLYQETNWVNDLTTINAEYDGIFNYENIIAPSALCSTGNCTWPTVPSLAVCGSCTDVTSDLDYSCVGVPEPEDKYSSYYQNCTYTLHDGSRFSEGHGHTFWTSPTAAEGTLAFEVVGGYTMPEYNISNHAYIDQWLMISMEGNVTANACGLWFCVQAYETKVVDGVQSQTVLGNWSELDIKYGYVHTYGLVNFTGIPEEFQTAENYSIGAGTLIAFEQNPIFEDANVTYGADSAQFYSYTSAIVRSLHGIVNYNSWIDKFALGMSNNIRSTGNSTAPSKDFAGQAFTSVAYVHVRWAWLAFPAAMVLASTAFLMVCIWQTSHLRVAKWKGNALSLLLSTVDEHPHRGNALSEKIGSQKAWLDSRNGNPVFRTAGGDEV